LFVYNYPKHTVSFICGEISSQIIFFNKYIWTFLSNLLNWYIDVLKYQWNFNSSVSFLSTVRNSQSVFQFFKQKCTHIFLSVLTGSNCSSSSKSRALNPNFIIYNMLSVVPNLSRYVRNSWKRDGTSKTLRTVWSVSKYRVSKRRRYV
jgi:hypothetical protein